MQIYLNHQGFQRWMQFEAKVLRESEAYLSYVEDCRDAFNEKMCHLWKPWLEKHFIAKAEVYIFYQQFPSLFRY